MPDANDSCCPPLQIESAPICERNPAIYKLDTTGRSLPRTSLTIRGVPAYSFTNTGTFERLELYTIDTTIIISAHDQPQAIRAAHAMVRAPKVPALAITKAETEPTGASDVERMKRVAQ